MGLSKMDPPIERLLVLLDGSALAECTLPHAVKVARALGASVCLLHVRESDHDQGARDRSGPAGHSEAQGYLSRLVPLFNEFGIPVETRIREGRPAEQALEVAAAEKAHLLVLSTHGHTGMTEFPMSGTAAKVLAGANVSLLVVRSQECPGGTSDEPYERILAAVDLTEHSDQSARAAGKIAKAEECELVLATVVPLPEVLQVGPGELERRSETPARTVPRRRDDFATKLAAMNRESADRHLAALKGELEAGGVRVRRVVAESKDVAMALEELAAKEDASLVVLGAHGRSEDPTRPQGAVAARLLERVTRPVLVLLHQREKEGSAAESSMNMEPETVLT